MNAEILTALVNQPQVHKLILGKYRGRYSLSVALSPENKDQHVLRLRVEGQTLRGLPEEVVEDGKVTVNGYKVPVVVEGSYRPPRALRRTSVVRRPPLRSQPVKR